jgi:predicted RND superfamily exporter protein
VLGYLVLLVSPIALLQQFGLLLAITPGFALLAAVAVITILPPVRVIFRSRVTTRGRWPA